MAPNAAITRGAADATQRSQAPLRQNQAALEKASVPADRPPEAVATDSPPIQPVDFRTDLGESNGAERAGRIPASRQDTTDSGFHPVITAIDGGDSVALDLTPAPATSQSQPTAKTLEAQTVQLQQVLDSVAKCYPLIDLAFAEIEATRGKVIASLGEFDTILSAHSRSQPLGFYQTYRNGADLTRPLWQGGEVYGNYRIGDGNFEPWYGERETNEGGEFKAGFRLPLLKDQQIDQRRADLLTARLHRDEVEQNVRGRLLQFQRLATQAYWEWLAAGLVVEVQKEILELAEDRVRQIDLRIEQGDLAQIAKIDNDRFIAQRKTSVIKAQRKFENSAIKLSLFLRDENCQPLVLTPPQLPNLFPQVQRLGDELVQQDIRQALSLRPELAELETLRRQTWVALNYAQNLTLPKLDFIGFAGQDLGAAASSKGDKTPFELQLGLEAEVPLQRREGAGKIREASSKLAQIDAKRQFLVDKITAEIRDAVSAINAAHDRVEQSRLNLDLNREALRLARLSFEVGDIDLIELNFYEVAVADAQIQLIDAQLDYAFFESVYETAITGDALVTPVTALSR